MSRSLNSLSKFARPHTEIGCSSSFGPSQLLPTRRNISHLYTRTCIRPGPLLVVPTACVPLRSGFGNVRQYANFPGGGLPQGFPGLGQQQQKGDALKEYVRCLYVFSPPELTAYFAAERGFDRNGKGGKTGSNHWKRRRYVYASYSE